MEVVTRWEDAIRSDKHEEVGKIEGKIEGRWRQGM